MNVVFRDDTEEIVHGWFQDKPLTAREEELHEEVRKIAARECTRERQGLGAKEIKPEETSAAQGALAKQLKRAERRREQGEDTHDEATTEVQEESARGGGTHT